MRIPIKVALRLAYRRLRPRTRVAWFTIYVAGMELLLIGLKYALQLFRLPSAAASIDPWSTLLIFLLAALLAFLGLRWFRNYVMWRVRNRLIVTYIFIGGIPVFLVVLMAAIAGYLLTDQFATFLTVSDIHAQLQELQAANGATAQQIVRSGQKTTLTKPEQIQGDENVLPDRTILILPESSRPKWLQDGFNGLVVDHGQAYLRAANLVRAGDKEIVVVSTIPVNEKFLARIAAGLGPVTIYAPMTEPGKEAHIEQIRNGAIVEENGKPVKGVSAGSLPQPEFSGDRAFNYYAYIQPTDWTTGKSTITLLTGSVRLSTLYSRLSTSLNDWAQTIMVVLTGLAIFFGVIVLTALVIGIRLTRTITRSVANLYTATQHINRGDFSHRIQVKERDQLAALQVAFNSMTQSLEKLIEEQKEKERLQSELAIAQEVQAQLFPRAASGTKTLDVYGVCRPARMVSGDYYDFLPYGSEQVGLAVGDISGKGISAALLMATIHSAVRAYEQDQLLALTSSLSSGHGHSGSTSLAVQNSSPQSPSQMLWLLNRQLYKTTQPEKYATLFLGFYDGLAHQLTYSNGGHLPPFIMGANGSLRRLETGGTVVGLFDNVQYDESTIQLYPGDIFVAFSDGITEPENEFGEFGEERLIETIEAHRNLPLDRITDNVIAAVQDWIGSSEQPDDITLVLARPRL